MIYHVQFPGLGLECTVNRVAFTLFGMPIYWYGILIAPGMMLALLFVFRYARAFGVDSDRLVDVVLLGTVLSIIGGRVYYVAMAPFAYDSFMQMLDIRQGGMAIYGSVIGAFLGGLIGCKVRKVAVLPTFDLAAMGFLIGQGIGRWGNFVNQEAFGCNTTLPWGMISEGTRGYLESAQAALAAQGVTVDPSMPVHPTFFYESVWCLLGFFVLWAYMKHRRFHGEIFLMYLIWYGFERFFVEGLRTDSLMLGSFRVSQLLAGVSVLAALALLLVLRRKYKGKPLTVTLNTFPKVDGVKAACTVVWRAKIGIRPPTDAQIIEQVRALRAMDDVQDAKNGPTAYFMTWVTDAEAEQQATNAEEEAAEQTQEGSDGGTEN